MPRADVGVIGAGLAGLAAAVALAEANRRVTVLARGHAATHWGPGEIDIAVAPGAATPRAAMEALASQRGHPYGLLAPSLPGALDWIRRILSDEGLDYAGSLDDPIRPLPTAIGATRPAAILPRSMAGALAEWRSNERLVVCGFAGFRDFWPEQIAASLRRPGSWRGADPPARIDAVSVVIPGLAGRHNLSGLDLARMFDTPSWRTSTLDAIARALDRGGRGAGRVCLPAVLGLEDHAAVFAAATSRLPLAPFEVPLAPPSVPGLRLYGALRAALRRRGGRIQVGEAAHGYVGGDRRVYSVSAPAAAREFILQVDDLVLATGGIAGGGIVADEGGTLRETTLGLAVDGPAGDWLRRDPFDPDGHPLERCGIRVDSELRPLAPGSSRRPVATNVRICGSLLSGQRYLREHCGDGVAIASAVAAARSIVSPVAESAARRGARPAEDRKAGASVPAARTGASGGTVR